jgi:alpha-L-fucosidase
MIPQFKDLVTRYKPSIIFGDGEWEMSSADWHAPELLAWLFNDSPVKDEVVINDRWGSDTRHKHGGYWTTEYTAGMSGVEHPWEENRGMGVSYGYNRAEDLDVYHTGRELVFILVDTASRGGNLLLDIGPKADGTIPVIMEQRLKEIGDWLKINGEAIYGTKPWKNTRQWTAGEVPRVEYNKEFSSAYDVTKLIESPSGAKASIEAFFTAKDDKVYAILPRWSGHTLVLKDLSAAKSVGLLGSSVQLKFKNSKAGLEIELPDLPENLRAQPAWVLKIAQ